MAVIDPTKVGHETKECWPLEVLDGLNSCDGGESGVLSDDDFCILLDACCVVCVLNVNDLVVFLLCHCISHGEEKSRENSMLVTGQHSVGPLLIPQPRYSKHKSDYPHGVEHLDS